ncbi:hypothetical protein BD413DRAFT_144327 [Trametes elegans]|nr:hypothetical protein BD413DRAFT_144327 [Trametes elegans]
MVKGGSRLVSNRVNCPCGCSLSGQQTSAGCTPRPTPNASLSSISWKNVRPQPEVLCRESSMRITSREM